MMKLIIILLIYIVALCYSFIIEFDVNLIVPEIFEDVANKALNIAQEQLSLGDYCESTTNYDCGSHHEYKIRRVFPKVTFNILKNQNNYTNSIAILGAFYSTDSISISNNIATPLNLPMISYGSTATELSDPNAHKFFSRVVPSNDLQASAMLDLCYRFNWRNKIALLGSTGAYGESGVISMKYYSNLYSMKIEYEGMINNLNITIALQELKAKNCNYILAFVTDDKIKEVLSAAKDLQMLQGDYIFIFSENAMDAVNIVDDKISFKNGTNIENELLNGIFLIESSSGFWRRDAFLKEKWQKIYPNTEYPPITPYIYDSLIILAKSVDSLLLKTVDPSEVHNGKLLLQEIRSQELLGASGRILLNKDTGDRLTAPYTLMNVNSNLKISQVTRWELGRKFTLLLNNVNLPGGKSHIINLESSVVEVIGRSGQFYPIPDSSTTPAPRYGSSFSIHNAESLLVVFGGRIHIERRYNDLWIYDLKESLWRQVFSFRTPEARSEHVGFTWKASNNEYFFSIFGGYNGIAILQEHWNYQFSLNSWIEFDYGIVPGARLRSRTVTYNESTYLVGGEGILSDYNDIWKFSHNSASWSLLEVTNQYIFPNRHDHCLCATDGSLFVWAGRSMINTAGMNDTFLFNISSNTWKKIVPLNVPIVRYAPICEGSKGVVYLGLGYSYHPDSPGRPYGDFYKLDLNPTDGIYRFIEIAKTTPDGWEGRDHMESVQFNGFLLIFAGWGPYSILNDFFRLSFQKENLEIVHPSLLSPPNLYDFEYATIGNSLYVFGGNELKTSISYSSDFFKLDLDTLTWSSLFPSKKPPPPSGGHATVAYSDILLIHGGISSTGFLNNLWLFSVLENAWGEITFQSYETIPSSRAYHSAEMVFLKNIEKEKIYLFGGLLKDLILEDVWEFNVDEYYFREVTVKNNGIKPLSLVHMQAATLSSEQLILLYSGEDFAVTPNSNVYSFDPLKEQYDIFAEIPVQYQTSRSRIVANSNSLYIHGGSFFDEISDLLLEVRKNNVTRIDISSSAIKPERRSDHGIVLFGHRLIIFGGVGAVPSKKVQSDITVYNNLFEYRLGPICLNNTKTEGCYLCTPGTYHRIDRCVSCPQGYYSEEYGQTECKPCPPGFYGALPGSSSSKLCFPCQPNTWQDNAGSASCKLCDPNNDYCPIGTTKKLNRIIGMLYDNLHIVSSEQPLDWPDNSIKVNTSVQISIIVCCSIIIILFFSFCLGFIWLRKCVFMLDFLFNEKHNYRIGEMRRKKTNPGGILTIVFFILWLTVCFNIIFPYIINNTRDEKTLTPTLSSIGSISHLVASVNFTGPQDIKCTLTSIDNSWTDCHPTLEITESNIKFDRKEFKCMRTVIQDEGLFCHIRAIYKDFNTISSFASILFNVNEPTSFASFIGWNISTSSSYPIQNNIEQELRKEINAPETIFSRAEGVKYCSQAVLFRGKQNPTSMSFKYIPTIFKYSNLITTGAHVQNSQFTVGSLVDSISFTSQNGFIFSFDLQVGESTLHIERVQRKSVLSLLYEVGGATSGLLSLLVIVLRFYESAQTLIINSRFVKKSKFLQKILKFKKPKDFLEILDRVKANKEKEKDKLTRRKIKFSNNELKLDNLKEYSELEGEGEFVIDEVELKEAFLNDSKI